MMAAICLRCLATAVPDKHASMLRAFLNSATMEYAELSSCKPEEVKLHLGPLQGSSFGVAGLLAIVPSCELGVPSQLTKFALKTAKRLVAVDANTNAGVAVARTESAWAMISALMELGPTFWVERKLTDLVSLFAQAMNESAAPPTTERNVVVLCRTKTYMLAAVSAFATHNRSLLSTEIATSSDQAGAAATSTPPAAAGSAVTVATVLGRGLDNILKLVLGLSSSISSYQASTIDLINVFKIHLLYAFKSLPEVCLQSFYRTHAHIYSLLGTHSTMGRDHRALAVPRTTSCSSGLRASSRVALRHRPSVPRCTSRPIACLAHGVKSNSARTSV